MAGRFFQVVDKKFMMFPNVETILPKRADNGSACYDFYAKEDIILNPGDTITTYSDVKACFPNTEVLLVFARSGLGIKKRTTLTNDTGVIDSSHYGNPVNGGNIGIALVNESDSIVRINKGERVCQGLFTFALFTNDDEVIHNERLEGMGSSNR